MEMKPPFGYQTIVPFNKTQKVRLLRAGEVPGFARSVNALPISFTEFALVQRSHPIVFTSGAGGHSAVAVLGMTDNENLFDMGGTWETGVYVPAYARRFPFCMARVTLDKVEQQQRLVCVEKAFLDEAAGEAMFDAEGQPLEKWKQIEKLLQEYEIDLERGREMCSILADYNLLEPFVMQAKFSKGGSAQMSGMQRVNEAKLGQLNASQLKNLLKKGILGRIYAHILSLDNFAKLLDRKASKSLPAAP
jgi:hypothetical protein